MLQIPIAPAVQALSGLNTASFSLSNCHRLYTVYILLL